MEVKEIQKSKRQVVESIGVKEAEINEKNTTIDSYLDKIACLTRELCSTRVETSASKQRYSVEISTVSKLVDLYKESSEEWSKKVGEMKGVIKALETHLSQVESDYKDKLEKEIVVRKEARRVFAKLKENLINVRLTLSQLGELMSGRCFH